LAFRPHYFAHLLNYSGAFFIQLGSAKSVLVLKTIRR
jgi:hypothetical protein